MEEDFHAIPEGVSYGYVGSSETKALAKRHINYFLEKIELSDIGENPSVIIYYDHVGNYDFVSYDCKISGYNIKKDSNLKVNHKWVTNGGTRISMTEGKRIPMIVTFRDFIEKSLAS